MKTRIITIGNSRGIRIPKPLLEQTGLEGEVELEVRDRHIIIHPANHAREGWAAAFEAMAVTNDDALLDSEVATNWDEEDWEW